MKKLDSQLYDTLIVHIDNPDADVSVGVTTGWVYLPGGVAVDGRDVKIDGFHVGKMSIAQASLFKETVAVRRDGKRREIIEDYIDRWGS